MTTDELRDTVLRMLGEIARADAHGIEILYLVQHRLDLVHLDMQVLAQGLLDFLELAAQIAVLADGVDQCERNLLVGVRKRRHLHLPQQVIAQGLRRAVARIDIGEILVRGRRFPRWRRHGLIWAKSGCRVLLLVGIRLFLLDTSFLCVCLFVRIIVLSK